MKIARIFPSKTHATPDDELCFFGSPPDNISDIADVAHVSVCFTYDIVKAVALYNQWRFYIPTEIDGPAFKNYGGEFTPGMYLKMGYTITHRGCPNRCWFCNVWKNEGNDVRELDIKEGHIIQDNNILACSDDHINAVFDMLEKQKEKAEFPGGLEAARLKPWVVDRLWHLRPKQMFFAYDTKDDLEPLIEAGRMLRFADFTRYHLRCYVLMGYMGDTIDKAMERLIEAWRAGFLPFAMLYKDKNTKSRKGYNTKEWEKFQRSWCRPAGTKAMMRGTCEKYF